MKQWSNRSDTLINLLFTPQVAQYIGEMCRYLLAVPEHAEEKEHNVRIVVGNGLRPAIWTQFCERFNIPEVGEFYGATESNSNLSKGILLFYN